MERCPSLSVTRLKSGPLGGDQQIGAMIAEGKVDVLFFFVDPLSPHPHDVDVKALMRLALVYDIPMVKWLMIIRPEMADDVPSSGHCHRRFQGYALQQWHRGYHRRCTAGCGSVLTLHYWPRSRAGSSVMWRSRRSRSMARQAGVVGPDRLGRACRAAARDRSGARPKGWAPEGDRCRRLRAAWRPCLLPSASASTAIRNCATAMCRPEYFQRLSFTGVEPEGEVAAHAGLICRTGLAQWTLLPMPP